MTLFLILLGLWVICGIVALISSIKELDKKDAHGKERIIKDNYNAIKAHRRKANTSWSRTGKVGKI